MKASELRIGNLLELTNFIEPSKVIIVSPRFFSSAIASSPAVNDFEITQYYKPIPLTDEWLVKFGFKRGGYMSSFEKLTIHHKEPVYPNGRVYFNSWAILNNIPEYVHQLQNLYFALTGKELIFDKSSI